GIEAKREKSKLSELLESPKHKGVASPKGRLLPGSFISGLNKSASPSSTYEEVPKTEWFGPDEERHSKGSRNRYEARKRNAPLGSNRKSSRASSSTRRGIEASRKKSKLSKHAVPKKHKGVPSLGKRFSARKENFGIVYYFSKPMIGSEQRTPSSKKLVFCILMVSRKIKAIFPSTRSIKDVTNNQLRKVLQKRGSIRKGSSNRQWR
uniref:Uncharacterized protein n=1 Tax=Cannabis sativa TaxID=3483 RepID=A0A803QSU9_CANSA